VGSLSPTYRRVTFVSCANYVRCKQGPATIFDRELKGGAARHRQQSDSAPGKKLAPEFKIHPGKIYVQMRGPRFETKAECASSRIGATSSA